MSTVRRAARSAAFLAVALFTLAAVRSQVMQVAMATPMAPICASGMPGMAMGAAETSAPGKAHKTCEFCADAAHAPLQADPVRLLPPTAVAPVPPYAVQATLGPRGPPAFTPKARGPPSTILAA